MIKRIEILYTVYSGDYIKRRVEKELSVETKLDWNLINWLQKFEANSQDGKKFSGTIIGNKIELRSKTIFYWPKTIIEIEEGTKTKLILNYSLYWLYVLAFTILVLGYSIMIFESGSFLALDLIMPLILFGVIATFGRWLQNNTKNFFKE